MTGFRVALGGAQAHYKVVPDLTTLGKIIGGGMPVGAFGGRADIMNCIAPLGPVYQAGTLSGNPVAMTAGLTTLEVIESDPEFYQKLNANTQKLMQGLSFAAKESNIPFTTTAIGGMFGLFFEKIETFKKFFHGMLREGIYLAPSAYEAGFISSAHGEKEINQTIVSAKKVFSNLS